MVLKGHQFISENYDICENKLKHQIISYERAFEQADQQFFEEQKLVQANLKNVSNCFIPLHYAN